MKSITPFLIVFFFPLILCSQSNLLKKYNINNKQFKFYSKLNENEKRLIEFKDEDEHLILKIALLNLINKHREKHRRKPIELDIHACRSANKTAQMSAKNEYCGHWDLEGKKPYHRYGLDGGEDHISENASATWSSAKIDMSLDNMYKMMKESHNSMYKEKPPNDGHRQNILESNHNFVGLGIGNSKKYFSYYEEFIDRYLLINDLKIKGKNVFLKFKVPANYFLVGINISYDLPFKPMSPRKINSKNSYLDQGKKSEIVWDDDVIFKNGVHSYSFKMSKKEIAYIQVLISKNKPKTNRKTTKKSFSVTGHIVLK
jgi:hypothetical protein